MENTSIWVFIREKVNDCLSHLLTPPGDWELSGGEMLPLPSPDQGHPGLEKHREHCLTAPMPPTDWEGREEQLPTPQEGRPGGDWSSCCSPHLPQTRTARSGEALVGKGEGWLQAKLCPLLERFLVEISQK